MRLIDADSLVYAICNKCDRLMDCVKSVDTCHAVKKICDAPTIDPVKHGHWIWYYTSEMILATGVKEYTPMFQCSACGHRYESYRRYDAPQEEDADYPKYCENCGAKMYIAERLLRKKEIADYGNCNR